MHSHPDILAVILGTVLICVGIAYRVLVWYWRITHTTFLEYPPDRRRGWRGW